MDNKKLAAIMAAIAQALEGEKKPSPSLWVLSSRHNLGLRREPRRWRIGGWRAQ